jgi:hypothetical protein
MLGTRHCVPSNVFPGPAFPGLGWSLVSRPELAASRIKGTPGNRPAPSPRPAFHQWRDVEGTPIPLLCRVAQIAVRPEHEVMPSRLHQHGQVIGRDTTCCTCASKTTIGWSSCDHTWCVCSTPPQAVTDVHRTDSATPALATPPLPLHSLDHHRPPAAWTSLTLQQPTIHALTAVDRLQEGAGGSSPR